MRKDGPRLQRTSLVECLTGGKAVLVLGAHCDDAALGCGGLLVRLSAMPEAAGARIGMTFTGGGNASRVAEEQAAAKALGLTEIDVRSYPDTLLPDHSGSIKDELLRRREAIGVDRIGLVLCPSLEDRHQDHRIVAENAWRIFRDHVILEYEILKYEADLPQPNFYVGLTEAEAERKAAILEECYPSRARHHWWGRQRFLSLMQIRGVQANCRYAEAYVARKLVV